MARVQLILDTNIEKLLDSLDKAGVKVNDLEKETVEYGQKSKKALGGVEEEFEDINDAIKQQKKLLQEVEREEKRLTKAKEKGRLINDRQYKRVQADVIQYRKELSALQKKQKQVNTTTSKGSKIFKKLGVTLAAAFSVALVTRFFTASARLFDEQIQAETKLLTALKGRETVQKRLLIQAKRLQSETRFGDEAVIETQAQLAKLLGDNEEAITRLTPLVLDLATTQNMQLVTSADLVAKSVGSSVNALSRYGIVIEGAVGTSERLESAVKALTKSFGGQAKAAAEVGTGAIIQFQNVWTDLQEVIGGFIARAVTPLFKGLSELIAPMDSIVDRFHSFSMEVGQLEKSMTPLIDEYDALTDKTELNADEQERMDILFKSITTALPIAVTEFDKYGVAMGLSTDKAREFIQAQKDLLRLKNAEAIADLENQLNSLEIELASLSIEMNRGSKSIPLAVKGFSTLGTEIEQTNEDLQDFNEEGKKLRSEITKIKNLLKLLTGEWDNFADGAGDAEKSIIDFSKHSNAALITLEKELTAIKKEELTGQQANELLAIQTLLKARREAFDKHVELFREETDITLLEEQFRKESLDRAAADLDAFILKLKEVEEQAKKVQKAMSQVFDFDDEEFIPDLDFDPTEELIKHMDDLPDEVKEKLAKFNSTFRSAWQSSKDFADEHPIADLLGLGPEELEAINVATEQVMNTVNMMVASRVAATERLVSDLNTRIAEKQREVQEEGRLSEQGFANNITLKKKELDTLQKLRDKAIQDREDALRTQLIIEGASQAVTLITAGANIIKGFSEIPIVGVALGIAAVATMIAYFANIKKQAAALTKYEHGGYLDGPPHSKGGIKIPGTNIEIEGKEYLTNKKSTKKYRGLLEAINADDFSGIQRALSITNKQVMGESSGANILTSVSLDDSEQLHEIANILREDKTEVIYGDGYIIEKSRRRNHKIMLN